jgi:integrase/recombinase XerD
MIETEPLGPILHSFFIDHLITVKGLRPSSVRSYRDDPFVPPIRCRR